MKEGSAFGWGSIPRLLEDCCIQIEVLNRSHVSIKITQFSAFIYQRGYLGVDGIGSIQFIADIMIFKK